MPPKDSQAIRLESLNEEILEVLALKSGTCLTTHQICQKISTQASWKSVKIRLEKLWSDDRVKKISLNGKNIWTDIENTKQ